MSRYTPKTIWPLLTTSASEFMENNSFRLAAALAYNTIFSLPPLLFISLMAAGAFFGEAAMSGQLYEQSKAALGEDAATQIQDMINHLNKQETHGIAKWIGFATLFFAATTFFVTLQESLNAIWNIKLKSKSGMMRIVKARLLSFGMILSIALLMLISFAISAVLGIFTAYLKKILPDFAVYLLKLLDFVISTGIMTLLFAMIYKILPDAITRWRDVWAGAAITAFLFVMGKLLIGWYLSASNVGSAYGVAGSIIIILAWIYYSSLIVFYGAELTQEYAKHFGQEIRPKSYAVRYAIQEIPSVNPHNTKAGRPKSEGSFRKHS